MNNEAIGRFIAEQRKRKNKTQKELAELLGVTNKAVSKWECGDGYPEITIVPALAEILDVSVGELLQGERNEQASKKGDSTIDASVAHASEQADYLLMSAFHRFKNLYMIAIGIMIIGLISFFMITLVTYYEVLGFGVELIILSISGMLIYVTYNNLKNEVLKYKQLYSADKTTRTIMQDVGKQLQLSMRIGFLSLMFSLPYLIFDHSQYTKSILSFDHYVYIVPFFLLIGGAGSYYAGRPILRTFYTKWGVELPEQLGDANQSEDVKTLRKFSLVSPLFFCAWFAYCILISAILEEFFGSIRLTVWFAVLILIIPIIFYIGYSIRLIMRQAHRQTKMLLNGYIIRDVVSAIILFYSNFVFTASYGFDGMKPVLVLFLLFFVGMTALIERYIRKISQGDEMDAKN